MRGFQRRLIGALPLLTVGVVIGGASPAAAVTTVTGQTDPSGPLVIDPSSDPGTPLTEGIGVRWGSPIMFIQSMPQTKLVNEVTIGDLARDPGCPDAPRFSLSIREHPTGSVSAGSLLSSSTEHETLPLIAGKVTWSVEPLVLRAGRAYSIVLQSTFNACLGPDLTTWPHNQPTVNHGGLECDEVYVYGHRMWHSTGLWDVVPCPYLFEPDDFDETMPGGWLFVDDRFENVYIINTTAASPPPVCPMDDRGTEPVYWRIRPSPPTPVRHQWVCRWTRFEGLDEPEPSDGWYYARGYNPSPGSPRDAYLRLDLDKAALATKYKPALRFDSSEKWRPIDVDRFLAELDGANPRHRVCSLPDRTDCVPVADTEILMASWDDDDAFLDIDGSDIPDYYSGDPECTVTVSVYECNAEPGSAIYWRVTDATVANPYRFVQYWMFYRFNAFSDGVSILGNHEGDWEAFAVAPSGDQADTFDFASFSSHGTWYSYLRENLRCDDVPSGTSCGSETNKSKVSRIEVFVANGSHANYPQPCAEVVPWLSCSQPDGITPERGHNGSAYWGNIPSWNTHTSTGLRPLPTDTDEWPLWQGRWGQENAPASPGQQTMFDPSWDGCADDDCPLPPAALRGCLRTCLGFWVDGGFVVAGSG